MLHFKTVTMEDRPWIHELLYRAGRKGCEYSFAKLFFWLSHHSRIARVGDFLCIRTCYGGKCSYFYPAGQGDVASVLEQLQKDAESIGAPFLLRGVTEDDRAELETLDPKKFEFTPLRDTFDYTYPVEKLANLAGKKLQSKRNHINRFLAELEQWHTEELTHEHLPAVLEMLKKWYENRADAKSLTTERSALETALFRREYLGMEGIVLFAGSDMVAFSMGNRISPKVFDVNFEKAFAEIPGAYPLVNREFARYIAGKYPEVELLNREDDMGLEGLRKAKESYYPDLLVKYQAAWRDDA